MRVLLTGFEPFGGQSLNPSWEVARALHGTRVAGAQVTAVQLPCVFAKAVLALQQALAQHRPNVVGTVGTNPVGKELDLAREIDPELKRVGLIFNPAEANSSYEAALMRQEAARRAITMVEQPVANAGEVPQAAKRLVEQQVEAFVKIGDYATIEAFAAICKVGLEHRIPVYSVDPPDLQLPGCLAVIGWNYRDDGMAAGKLAVRVLNGESPAQMAFQPLTSTDLLVSLATAKAIGVTVPEDLLQRADRVVR
jgi:putative ABC transport system substrate-binding protein